MPVGKFARTETNVIVIMFAHNLSPQKSLETQVLFFNSQIKKNKTKQELAI